MDDTMELGCITYDRIEEAIENKQWEKIVMPPTRDDYGFRWEVQHSIYWVVHRLLYVSPFHDEVMKTLLRICGEDTDWHSYVLELYPPLSTLRYLLETGRLSVNQSDDGLLLGRYLLLPDREAEVQYLLEQGACPNLQYEDTGDTILMYYLSYVIDQWDTPSEPFASIEKRVRRMMEIGIDPLLPNKYGLTPVDCVQRLLPCPEKERLLALLEVS